MVNYELACIQEEILNAEDNVYALKRKFIKEWLKIYGVEEGDEVIIENCSPDTDGKKSRLEIIDLAMHDAGELKTPVLCAKPTMAVLCDPRYPDLLRPVTLHKVEG